MKPVKSLDLFEQLQTQGQGFFIITDHANPTKIHHVNCSFVSVQNFENKVIENKGKNGHYSWIAYWDGRSREVSPCQKCMREGGGNHANQRRPT